MRPLSWLAPVVALGFGGLVVVACGSSSGGGGGGEMGGGVEGGGDSAEQGDQTASCGNLAACYSVTVTIAPGSPVALCGTGSETKVADYTAIPAGGGAFNTGAAGGGCRGVLTGCDMTLSCPNGEAWSFTFNGQGFDATVSLPMQGGTCMATAVGTKLGSCPVTTPGEAGAMEASTAEAGSPEGSSEAGPDATLDGPGAEASIQDAPDDSTGMTDHESAVEASVDSSTPEAAPAEASVEGGAQDAGSPGEAGEDAALDGGTDGASSGAEGGLAEAGDDSSCSTCTPDAAPDASEGGGDDASDGGIEAASE